MWLSLVRFFAIRIHETMMNESCLWVVKDRAKILVFLSRSHEWDLQTKHHCFLFNLISKIKYQNYCRGIFYLYTAM